MTAYIVVFGVETATETVKSAILERQTFFWPSSQPRRGTDGKFSGILQKPKCDLWNGDKMDCSCIIVLLKKAS